MNHVLGGKELGEAVLGTKEKTKERGGCKPSITGRSK